MNENVEKAKQIAKLLQKRHRYRYPSYIQKLKTNHTINCTDHPTEEKLNKHLLILKYFNGD